MTYNDILGSLSINQQETWKVLEFFFMQCYNVHVMTETLLGSLSVREKYINVVRWNLYNESYLKATNIEIRRPSCKL